MEHPPSWFWHRWQPLLIPPFIPGAARLSGLKAELRLWKEGGAGLSPTSSGEPLLWCRLAREKLHVCTAMAATEAPVHR